ncbi:MAG: radical SAM protein, partial [Candidatus Brocadiales bacterium]
MDTYIRGLGEKVLDGAALTRDEALFVHNISLKSDTIYDLLYWANKIRQRFLGSDISCCALVSAKQGKCPEDCCFCAQSVRFDTTVEEFPLMEREGLGKAVGGASGSGAGSLGIVTSGRELSDSDLAKLCERLRGVNGTNGVHIHASLGLLSPKGARELKGSGVRRINHNLETSERFFPR